MRWIGAWLIVATSKLVFAGYESFYEWSSESHSRSDSSFDVTENWRRDRPYLKRIPNSSDDAFMKRICSPEDPTRLYELGEKIGEGTFGKVYKGRRRSDGRHVAIKTVLMDQHPDMLTRELRALDIVTHSPRRLKTLPMMYAAYKDVTDAQAGILSNEPHRKRLWIVMELVEGLSILTSIKKEGHFEMQQVRTVMKQIMDTLCYIHGEHKLIHGDLIPQNIILNNRNQLDIKFIDFGLSRIVGESPNRTVAWELTKAGAMAYRLRFGDMPTYTERGRQERMNLSQLCAATHLTSKIPKDLLSFMNACAQDGAIACRLKDHAFLKGDTRKRTQFYFDGASDDHYEIEAAWFNRIAERDLYR